MQLYTLQQASANLGHIISQAVCSHEAAGIVSDSGAVVLIPQEEFESMQEMLRLVGDQRSLSALLAGHAQRDAGRQPEVPSTEQIFHDLQDSDS